MQRFLEFTGKENWAHIPNDAETNVFYAFELKKNNKLEYIGSNIKSYNHWYQQMQTTTYGEINKKIDKAREKRTVFLESLKGKDIVLSGSYKTYLVRNLSEIFIDDDYWLYFKGDDIIRVPFKISTSNEYERILDISVAINIINTRPIKYINLYNKNDWYKKVLCHGIELTDELDKEYFDTKYRRANILQISAKIRNSHIDRYAPTTKTRSRIHRLLEDVYKQPSYMKAGLIIYAWWNSQGTEYHFDPVPSDDFFMTHWEKACRKIGVSTEIYRKQFKY